MFGQLQVLNGDFPPFQQIPVKRHFVQVSVLWQPGPPPGVANEAGWAGVALKGLSDWAGGGGCGGIAPSRKKWHECRPPPTHVAAGGEGASAHCDPSPPISSLKGSYPRGDQ